MREEYKDNLICSERNIFDSEILNTYKKANGWLPFEIYDMIQCGYPYPDHGEMILRTFGGTNENSELLPPKGTWCKVKDVEEYLNKISEIKSKLAKTDLEHINYILSQYKITPI